MSIFKKIKKKFSDHPNSVGESYWEHFQFASKAAGTTASISAIMLLHAFFPFTYKTTASDMLNKLNKEMQKRNQECR